MTEKLYYQDAYLTAFDAVITQIREGEDAILLAFDRTAFYPEGGGQGPDLGTINVIGSAAAPLESANGATSDAAGSEKTIIVIDVQEEEEEIWHYVSKDAQPRFSVGTKIHGQIDWERRFDHMQQHSGEHIVSGMLCKAFHCDNVGFHMGEDEVTIDYNTRISLEEALQIEEQANRYLWENHPFVELWPTAEELKDLEYRSKKELEGDVRITRFPGADTCACCGTHVRNSAEVGLVKIVSAHNFHEGTRLVLLCGKRAMDFLNKNYQANKQTAVLLSTKEERTPEIVKKQQDDLIDLKAKLSRLEEDYFKLWAEGFSGKENALVITDQIDAEEGRALCDRIADQISGLAAVFTRVREEAPADKAAMEVSADKKTVEEDPAAAGPVYRYACMHRGEEIGDLIKEMNAALSGRGGGRNGFAQGSVKADKKKIHTFFTLKNLTNE